MRPGILRRYILRILALHWVPLFVGLMLIVTASQLPNLLYRAADHQLPIHLVLDVLLLMSVANMPVSMLLTLFFAVVLTVGKLSHESELTAMRAAGVSPFTVLVSVAMFAAPLVAALALVSHHFSPRAYCKAVLARADAARNLVGNGVAPGTFTPLGSSGTLFARAVAEDGELRNVFVYIDDARIPVVLTAARGRLRLDETARQVLLSLADGEVHEGHPGERRFRITRFSELRRAIPLPGSVQSCARPDALSTAQLWGSREGRAIAEINRRFGMVALAVALAIIAVPLSITSPRKGAYSRMPIAICVFAVAMFGVNGLAGWSAREPRWGTLVLWTSILFALCAGVLWLLRIQRGVFLKRRAGRS